MKRTAFDELIAYEVKDAFLQKALQTACELLFDTPEAHELGDFCICVYNPETASPSLRNSPYKTPACQAIYPDRTIILNEAFLREIEGAVRAFDLSESLLGSQYLQDDDYLFDLITRITADPLKHARQLRKFQNAIAGDGAKAADPLQEMVMAIFFFISHEIGHLIHKHAQASFSSFLDPTSPLESRVAHAVVKLCRHADEFDKFGFSLPGFKKAIDTESEVRKSASALKKSIADKALQDSEWFAAETSADDTATTIILRYLDELAATNPAAADRQQSHIFRALFVIGLYFWHKDLYAFAQALGVDRFTNSQILSIAMMEDRKQYIRAASLFGDVHRFTLLRAVRAMEELIAKRTSFFKNPGSIWCQRTDAEIQYDSEALVQWRHSENLQRFYLLSILMDTAVKIAHLGCSTGWMLEVDKKRGTPQLFMMQFESLRQAMSRLKNFG